MGEMSLTEAHRCGGYDNPKFTFEQLMKRGFAEQRRVVNTFVERHI